MGWQLHHWRQHGAWPHNLQGDCPLHLHLLTQEKCSAQWLTVNLAYHKDHPHKTTPNWSWIPLQAGPIRVWPMCTCSVSQDCLQITSMQARWVPPWCSLFSIFPVIYHLDIFRSEAEFPNGEFKCVIKVSHKDGLLEPVFKYGQWKITVNLTSSQIKQPHTVSAFFPHKVRWFFEILTGI